MYMYYVYAVCCYTAYDNVYLFVCLFVCVCVNNCCFSPACVCVCVCVYVHKARVCVCVYLWAQQVNCLTNSLEVLLLQYPLMSGDTQDWLFIPFHFITANVRVLYWLPLCGGS